jgi:GNAT superfamily N-acetyltransferase
LRSEGFETELIQGSNCGLLESDLGTSQPALWDTVIRASCMASTWTMRQSFPVTVETRDLPYDDPVVLHLVQEMADDLAPYYGPGSYPPQEPRQWTAPLGAMIVAYVDGGAVGCGGFVRHDDETGELKRMYVRLAMRRKGIGRQILHDLESRANLFGYRRLIRRAVCRTNMPKVFTYQRDSARSHAGFHTTQTPPQCVSARRLPRIRRITGPLPAFGG